MKAPLVGVMFDVLAAEMADPDRFRRGRALARRGGSVVDLEIEPGLARAEIQGSRPRPYVVTVRARPVRRGAEAAAAAGRLNVLVPRADDLTIACTCPDWGDPCKHGVAALVALGAVFAEDPDALARWRQSAGITTDEPAVEPVAPQPAQPLDAWFGRGFDPAPPAPLPAIATRVARPPNDDDAESLVVSAMADARAALARAFGRG